MWVLKLRDKLRITIAFHPSFSLTLCLNVNGDVGICDKYVEDW